MTHSLQNAFSGRLATRGSAHLCGAPVPVSHARIRVTRTEIARIFAKELGYTSTGRMA